MPLANLGFRNIRSLEPGTLAVANQDGVRIERFAPSPRQAHCFFEWIYFANVASTLDDRSVYLSRSALGKELARLEDVPLDADTIVVPVPDTAKAAADAMAFALRIPSVEGLMRNRYVGRTFIEGTADRAAKARLKYTPLPEVLKGKRVLLVEDSIVRSTTMRALVHEIRDRGGAREIHLRVACPPIIAPCYLRHRHVQHGRALRHPVRRLPGGGVSEEAQQEMARELGADSLRYLPVEAIARSVEPLARPALPRLHHGPLPHRDRPAALPDRDRHVRARPRTARRPGVPTSRVARDLSHPVVPFPGRAVAVVLGPGSPGSLPVGCAEDGPALDPELALEVGQVIEVVLGLLDFAAAAARRAAAGRRQRADHAEVLLDVGGHVKLSARLERPRRSRRPATR